MAVEAKAWSANEARANAPEVTWSNYETRVGARQGKDSTTDCNNGELRLPAMEMHRWTHWCSLKLVIWSKKVKATPEPKRQLWLREK